ERASPADPRGPRAPRASRARRSLAVRGPDRPRRLPAAGGRGGGCPGHLLRLRDGRGGERILRDTVRSRARRAAGAWARDDRVDAWRAALDDAGASLGHRPAEAPSAHAESGPPDEGRPGAHAARLSRRGRAVP